MELGSTTMLEATHIFKSFPPTTAGSQPLLVVDDFNLSLREGELVTFFGPNGCGKTTILNLLAGTITPDAGQVRWDGENASTLPVGYVFQNYADTLLPWRNVRSNIAFPLEARGLAKRQIAQKVTKWLEHFGLTEHADKYIYQLSGGLKQLVTIARSTVYEPRLLLLDEPFSSLDYSLSRMLWTHFRKLWSDLKVTTVFVSHNVDEALFLGDRVYVLSSRPTRVVAEVHVPFGEERQLALLTSQEFFSVRSEILAAFEDGRTP